MTTDIDNIIEQLKELYPYANRYIKLKHELIQKVKSAIVDKVRKAPPIMDVVKEAEARYKLPLLILDSGDLRIRQQAK